MNEPGERFFVGGAGRRRLSVTPEQLARASFRGCLHGKAGQIPQELGGLRGEQNLPRRCVLQRGRDGAVRLKNRQIGSGVNQDRGRGSSESLGLSQALESPLEAARSQDRGLNPWKRGQEEVAAGHRRGPVSSGNKVSGERDGWIAACPGQIDGPGNVLCSPQPNREGGSACGRTLFG